MIRARRLHGDRVSQCTNATTDRRTDDLGSHILGLLAGERWRQTARDDVDEDGLGRERRDRRLEQLRGLNALDEAHIGACVGREFKAGDGLLHTEHLRGVGAGDDHLRSDVTQYRQNREYEFEEDVRSRSRRGSSRAQ